MNNPLNSVDGNTMAWMADQDRERKDDGDAPQLTCNQCGEPLTIKEAYNLGDICADCCENENLGDKYGKA